MSDTANPVTDALRARWPDDTSITTDAAMLDRVLRRAARRLTGRPAWSNVSEWTCHGSGYSRVICRALGIDPDEVTGSAGECIVCDGDGCDECGGAS